MPNIGCQKVMEEFVGTFSAVVTQSLAAGEELAAADLHIFLQDCVLEVTQGGEPASPPCEAVAYHGMDGDMKPDTVSVQNFPVVDMRRMCGVHWMKVATARSTHLIGQMRWRRGLGSKA